MKPLGDERKHYWLATRMADAADVNLVEAFTEGRLSSKDWAGLVSRCRGCQWVEGCERWLDAEHPGADVPTDCRNGAVFEALKVPA